MKFRFIYIYYIDHNSINNEIYHLHHFLLKRYCHIFSSFDIVLLYDPKYFNDTEIIKYELIDILDCPNINFFIEENNSSLREGLPYKKYIIDKLGEYEDDLIFFGHTKGVSNNVGLEHIDNLKKWIFALYYLNFNWINEVTLKLLDYGHKNVTYGSLYFKDYRHNNINNWFYSGSFYWINPKRMLNIINENKIDISIYIKESNERLKRCAELFPGYILNEDLVAFHADDRYDKKYEPFHMYGWEISYKYIYLLIEQHLNLYEYDNFEQEYNMILNEL